MRVHKQLYNVCMYKYTADWQNSIHSTSNTQAHRHDARMVHVRYISINVTRSVHDHLFCVSFLMPQNERMRRERTDKIVQCSFTYIFQATTVRLHTCVETNRFRSMFLAHISQTSFAIDEIHIMFIQFTYTLLYLLHAQAHTTKKAEKFCRLK